MSIKYSSTGPLLARDESKSRESHIYSGQKSSHFTNKKGIDASIDKRNMELHEQARMAKYGSGVTRFAILNGDGQFDKDAVFESGGILFRPNHNGQFYAANESFLEEELKREEEIRDYVKKILKYCVNDETNKMIFGLNDKEYKDLFGPCTPAKREEYGARKDTIPQEVAELNCMASYMETLLLNLI